MARRNFLVALKGQSNERGRGLKHALAVDGDAARDAYGIGQFDPILPNGDSQGAAGYRSWWPQLAERLARERKILMYVENTAVGGTSIHTQWCGSPLPADLNTDPTDPNGYMGVVDTRLSAWSNGFDEKWMFISFGQSDAVIPTSLANYRDSHICAANYCLNRGYKVAIGLSCRSNSGATWYGTTGKPAIQAALAHFAGNPNVIAGADLYTALGTSFDKTYDGSHLYSKFYDEAANAWFEALVAGGW